MEKRNSKETNDGGVGKQYVDLHPECFGKQNLRKGGKLIGFESLCKHDCRMKNECINASREEREHIEYHNNNIPYDSAISSSLEDAYDEDGAPVSAESESDDPIGSMTEEKPSSVDDYIEKMLKQNNCPTSSAPAFRAVLEQFFVQTKEMPRFTSYLSAHVLEGMNQAEYARRKEVTRASIGAGISLDIAGINRMKVDVPKELNEKEKLVYLLYFKEGLSIREAAKKLSVSHMTVKRMLHLIEAKINKNVTLKNRKAKKTQKKIRRTKEQIKSDEMKVLREKARRYDLLMKIAKGFI